MKIFRYFAAVEAIAAAAVMILSLTMLPALVGCGSGSEEEPLTLADPEWRSNVQTDVSFPLGERLTIAVGMGGVAVSEAQAIAGDAAGTASGDSGTTQSSGSSQSSGPKNISREWLEEYANIELKIVGLPSSPGDVLLGEMIRDGELPDILPERRFDLRLEEYRMMFVNLLEFPNLTPNITALRELDPDFDAALIRKYTGPDELLSAGTYAPFEKPFAGTIAFREDLFRRHGLGYDTWDELYRSMKKLKELYPGSYPFGATGDSLTTMGPAWFGSGYRTREVVYYNPDAGLWAFGPGEAGFKEFLDYFQRLHAEELLLPEYVMVRREDLSRYWMNESWMIAPHGGYTGLQFPYRVGEYGELNADGEWDGSGIWISAMPVPRDSNGNRGRISSTNWTNLGPGWLVNNQSPHVGEAVAFIDLLYREDVARVLQFGPEGVIWEERNGEPRFIPAISAPYNPTGRSDYKEYLKDAGLAVGFPVQGVEYNPESILGLASQPYYRYYLQTDIGTYLDEGSIGLYAVPSVPFTDDEWEEIANITVSLSSHIESYVANYIIGRKGVDSYDEFLEECVKIGSDRLVEMYNGASVRPGTTASTPSDSR